jgi:hypothetical protein
MTLSRQIIKVMTTYFERHEIFCGDSDALIKILVAEIGMPDTPTSHDLVYARLFDDDYVKAELKAAGFEFSSVDMS